MKTTFEKGYMTNWTEGIFKVTAAQPATRNSAPAGCKVRDWNDEPGEGVFYFQQI